MLLPASVLTPVPERPAALPRRIAALLMCVALLLTACGTTTARSTAHPLPNPTPTPINANQTVYASTAVQYGSDALYALRASDGALRWKLATDSGYWAPLVADGVLYEVLNGTAVEALDARGLTLRWRRPLAAWGAGHAPVLDGGVLYFGAFAPGSANPPTGVVYALRASDGAVLWQVAIGGAVYAQPAVADGVAYIAATDSYLYALRARDGVMLWRHALSNFPGDTMSRTPAVANGVVYISADHVQDVPIAGTVHVDNFLLALRASDGSLLWRAPIGSVLAIGAISPAVVDGVVYVGAGDAYAFRAGDGALLWHAAGKELAYVPAAAGGVVYFGSTCDSIAAFNAQDGSLRWRYQASPDCTYIRDRLGPPVVAGDVLYFGAFTPTSNMGNALVTGAVVALDARDGAHRWLYLTPGPVLGSVAVAP